MLDKAFIEKRLAHTSEWKSNTLTNLVTRSKNSLIPSSVQETLILKNPDKKITDQGYQITNLRSLIADN